MLLHTLLSLFVLAAPASDGWSRYINERHGYSVAVPPGLQGQGESDNGDGQVFQDASGKVQLKVWASPVVELEGEPEGKTNLAWHRRASLGNWRDSGVRVTYQPKGKGWWVLSGEDTDGRVHYLKVHEKAGAIYGFEWIHPKGDKPRQDATSRIAKGFQLP